MLHGLRSSAVKSVYKSHGLSGVLNLLADSDDETSWQALQFIQQRQAKGKLPLTEFTADLVPLQLAALGRDANDDKRGGQRQTQILRLLQMQAAGNEEVKAALQKEEAITPLLPVLLNDDAETVRSAHGLLSTLCEDAELRQAMRDADGVTLLVAALEKPRDPADLDVKGRMAGLLTALTDDNSCRVSQLADATSEAGGTGAALNVLQRMQAAGISQAMWPVATDLLRLLKCLTANSAHACQVVAREGGVATLLALATDPGVDATCLPLAMSVLDSTAAAAPETSAKQLREVPAGIAALRPLLQGNDALEADTYAAALPATGVVAAAAQGDPSLKAEIASCGIIESLITLLHATEGGKRWDVTEKALAAFLALLADDITAQDAAADAGIVPALLQLVEQSAGDDGYDRTTAALDTLTAFMRGTTTSGNAKAQQAFTDACGALAVAAVLQRGPFAANYSMQQVVSGTLAAAAVGGGANAASVVAALVTVLGDESQPASPNCVAMLLETCKATKPCPGTPAALVAEGAPLALLHALQRYRSKGTSPDADEAIAALKSILVLAEASPDAVAALQQAGAVALLEQVARDAKPGRGESNEAKTALKLVSIGAPPATQPAGPDPPAATPPQGPQAAAALRTASEPSALPTQPVSAAWAAHAAPVAPPQAATGQQAVSTPSAVQPQPASAAYAPYATPYDPQQQAVMSGPPPLSAASAPWSATPASAASPFAASAAMPAADEVIAQWQPPYSATSDPYNAQYSMQYSALPAADYHQHAAYHQNGGFQGAPSGGIADQAPISYIQACKLRGRSGDFGYGSGSLGSGGYDSGNLGSGNYGGAYNSGGYGSGDYGSGGYGSGNLGSGAHGSGDYGSIGIGDHGSGNLSTHGSGSYAGSQPPTSPAYINSQVRELQQAQAKTIAQATAAATLPYAPPYPAGAAPSSQPALQPAYSAEYAPQLPAAEPTSTAAGARSSTSTQPYAPPMQPYAPVLVYGSEAQPQPTLVSAPAAIQQHVPQPYTPAPVQFQAAEKDVKAAGKLLGQLVAAQDAEERSDVMDTLTHKISSNPGFSAGLEQMKATLNANGQTATVFLLDHCTTSSPMQDPFKLDRAVADLLSRLAAPEDADDLADTLDTLHHKANVSGAHRAAVQRSPAILFVLRRLAQDGHAAAARVLECCNPAAAATS